MLKRKGSSWNLTSNPVLYEKNGCKNVYFIWFHKFSITRWKIQFHLKPSFLRLRKLLERAKNRMFSMMQLASYLNAQHWRINIISLHLLNNKVTHFLALMHFHNPLIFIDDSSWRNNTILLLSLPISLLSHLY